MTSFELNIQSIFRLSDGRTVIIGDIHDRPRYIESCRCTLQRGDQVRQAFTVEGEQMVKRTIETPVALMTFEILQLSKEEAASREWRLICR